LNIKYWVIHRLVSFKALWSCTETQIWTLKRLVPIEVHYMEKNAGMFWSKTLISFRLKNIDMDISDHMGVSKLSAKVFCFFLKWTTPLTIESCFCHTLLSIVLSRPKNRLKITDASSTWDYAFLAGQLWVMAHLAERTPLLPKHEWLHSSPFSSPSALRPQSEGVGEQNQSSTTSQAPLTLCRTLPSQKVSSPLSQTTLSPLRSLLQQSKRAGV